MNGIVPAVIQSEQDGTVLMVGYMNREALQRTLDEKQVTFWSRSKSRLWKKGETSGNSLNVVSVHLDCDADALLIVARPAGPVCHTGKRSCFSFERPVSEKPVLEHLSEVIAERKRKMPEGSYTAKLFREGSARIGQKVGEEAVELAIAAQYDDTQRCIEEAADLMYHTLVLLAQKGIDLRQVEGELSKRDR